MRAAILILFVASACAHTQPIGKCSTCTPEPEIEGAVSACVDYEGQRWCGYRREGDECAVFLVRTGCSGDWQYAGEECDEKASETL